VSFDLELTGRRVLVTAGPTYEDFDPVRFVGNRSSGRMGYAIAAEAARRGAEVTLVTGPTTLETPVVRELVRVRSAAEMHSAIVSRAGDMHIVVMAAAVADYAPVERAGQKAIVIGQGGERLKEIGRLARIELNDLWQRSVHLELWVKVKENWADSEMALRQFGYDSL